ncbi:MAG: hypothetical protein ACLRPE_12820 [Blautia producta]
MKTIHGTNMQTGKIVQLDRKSMPAGGHMLIIGETGMGKTFFIQQEIKQVLEESKDEIYIFTQRYWEFQKISRNNRMHYGNDETYESILQHGKEFLLEDKRIWVYFDQYLSCFNSDDWESFFHFLCRARTSGVIITISIQDFYGIPECLLPKILTVLECLEFFSLNNDTAKKLAQFLDNHKIILFNEYLKKSLTHYAIFYWKDTGFVYISYKSPKDGPIYTKEELEAQLEPVACRLPKEECPKGQDIVQVTLPWLDDANDCIEVYLVRKEDGTIHLEYD